MLSHISGPPPLLHHQHASFCLPPPSPCSLRKKTGQHLAEFMRERERELVDHENWEEFFLGQCKSLLL